MTEEQLALLDILYDEEWADYYWRWFNYLIRLEQKGTSS